MTLFPISLRVMYRMHVFSGRVGIFFMPTFCSTSNIAVCFCLSTDPSSVMDVAVVGSVPELGDWSEANAVFLNAPADATGVWSAVIPFPFLSVHYQYQYIIRRSDGRLLKDFVRTLVIPRSKQDVIDAHLQPGSKIIIEISDRLGQEGSRVRIFAPEHYSRPVDHLLHCVDITKLEALRVGLRKLREANRKLREDVVSMSSQIVVKPAIPNPSPDSESVELIKRLLAEINDLKGKVKVLCRFRPISSITGAKRPIDYSLDPDEGTVLISDHNDVYNPNRTFQVDDVFAEETTNLQFFLSAKLKSLVESCVIIQNNVCIFAYGQTSSGKTHTMIGNDEEEGVIPLAITTVYETIKSSKLERFVEAEVIEVYRENVFKLVDQTEVENAQQLSQLFSNALECRATASTNMNDRSSRSHCVFVLSLTEPTTQIVSKIFLVDLAGSERTKFSGAEGDRLAEANSINKSLSTLGMVLNGLLNRRKFIPYRDSKLTQVLAPVFTRTSPPSKIVMIANVSPSSSDFKETVSTLTFAQRVGEIEMRSNMEKEDKEKLRTKIEELNEVKSKPKRRLSRSRSFCA